MFIVLTKDKGGRIALSKEQMVDFYEHDGFCFVETILNRAFKVQESFDEVLRLVNSPKGSIRLRKGYKE